MPRCLICDKNLKTKKAYKTHEESKTHNANKVKCDLKTLFVNSFVALIYKYDEFREIETIYREFKEKYILTFRMAGFKSLEDIDFNQRVLVRTLEDKRYVKGYGNYVEETPLLEINLKFNDQFL